MLFAEAELDPEIQTIAVVIGALFMGAICGLWPLGAGMKKGRPGVGMTGFVACLGSGFVLGCLLALPMAIFFRLLIGVLERPPLPGADGLDSEPFNPYANGKRSAF